MSGTDELCYGGDTPKQGCEKCQQQMMFRSELARALNPPLMMGMFAIEQEASLLDSMRNSDARKR